MSEKFGNESERLALLLRIRFSMKYLLYLYLTESRNETCYVELEGFLLIAFVFKNRFNKYLQMQFF